MFCDKEITVIRLDTSIKIIVLTVCLIARIFLPKLIKKAVVVTAF